MAGTERLTLIHGINGAGEKAGLLPGFKSG
jgi:hypothetical protein